MAMWQFRLDFLPEREIRRKFGNLPRTLSKDVVEDYPWWSHVQPRAGFETQIDEMIPQKSSWSESMRIWGNEDGDSVYVIYIDERKDKIECIWCRIDVRSISHSFVRGICTLAQQLECILVTAKHIVLKADEASMLAAINDSTAKKYLEDPVATLIEMKESGTTTDLLEQNKPATQRKPN